ncbi:MAG: peptidylprolyl isomerase [Chromatiales bacterium]|jgi:peptidyl-prolyl cis-trans isomerase C
MKKTIPILLMAAVVLVAGCDQKKGTLPAPSTGNGANASEPSGDRGGSKAAADALVTVNGQPVGRQTFAAMLAEWNTRSPGSVSSPQVQAALLNEMVNFVILSQEAEKQGLQNSERVEAALDWARTKTLAQAMLNKQLGGDAIDESELRQAYEEKYPAAGTKEYKARHILVETEDEAKALITQLGEGADFAELAKEHSTGPSGSRGGELGWFGPADMVPPFSEAVAAMEKGAVSAEPVETGFGWHVILLEDVRENPRPAFESVKDELMSELRQKRIQEYVGTLREKATIEVNTSSASPQPSAGDATGNRPDEGSE